MGFLRLLSEAAIAFGAMQLETNAEIADNIGAIADNFDPFKIGEAGAGSENCLPGCGPVGAASSGGKLEGFQGVFRVNGRIDSKRLEREMEDKKQLS